MKQSRQTLYGIIQTSIMLVFFRLGDSTNMIISQAQAVSHMWMVVFLFSLMPFGANPELQEKISTGAVSYDLCRPLDLYWHWFTFAMSRSLSNLYLRAPLIILVAFLLPYPYTMLPPVSIGAFILFIISIILSLFLSGTIIILTSLTFINADTGRGFSSLISATIILLSGDAFPLSILPEPIVTILRLLPFAGLKDIPVSIYLGLISTSDVIRHIGIQVIWGVTLLMLGRFLLAKHTKKIIIQGG